MAEFIWLWGGYDGDQPPPREHRFWVPDGCMPAAADRIQAAVDRLRADWVEAVLLDAEDPPAWLEPSRRPVPHIRSVDPAAGRTQPRGLRLLLEVTSRWPAGSLAIPDEAREALGAALSCSDMPAESWRYLPWSEDGREACPTGPPWPSAPTVLCRPCGDRPLRSLIVMLGREPLWGAFCDRCCTVYWTRREPVVASVEVDLRPRRGLLPTTVTIGDREVPARVVEVTYERPGDIFDRAAFERELAVAAARERIARGEARPEDTDPTLFWSRPRRPRSG
jgi:hypothetical protein